MLTSQKKRPVDVNNNSSSQTDRDIWSDQSQSFSVSDIDDSIQLFRLNAIVVGRRFYAGHTNTGEIVHLVREPRNPYGNLQVSFFIMILIIKFLCLRRECN